MSPSQSSVISLTKITVFHSKCHFCVFIQSIFRSKNTFLICHTALSDECSHKISTIPSISDFKWSQETRNIYTRCKYLTWPLVIGSPRLLLTASIKRTVLILQWDKTCHTHQLTATPWYARPWPQWAQLLFFQYYNGQQQKKWKENVHLEMVSWILSLGTQPLFAYIHICVSIWVQWATWHSSAVSAACWLCCCHTKGKNLRGRLGAFPQPQLVNNCVSSDLTNTLMEKWCL